MLTTGVEDISGTAGNDTFNALVQDNDATTWNTGDLIEGGAGSDTLFMRIVDAQNGENDAVTMTGVETVRVRNLDDSMQMATIDASDWDGVAVVENYRSRQGVSIEGLQNNVTLKVADTASNLTVEFADDAVGEDATLAVELDGADGSTVSATVGGDDTVVSLSIDASGDDSNVTVEINEAAGHAELETLTITGDASLEITFSATEGDTLVSLDAGQNSGGVTFDATAVVAIEELTGSSGDDSITLASSADEAVIALGNGDDSLNVTTGGGVHLGVDVSIDLGAGDDTLTAAAGDLDDAAEIEGGAGTDTISSVAITSANRAAVTGFERLDVSGEGRRLDLTLLGTNSISSLVINDILSAATTVSGLAGTAIDFEVNASTSAALTATLRTSTGTADSANITFADDSTGITVTSFGSTSLERINIVSDGGTGANVLSAITDTANTLATITITGDQDFTLSDVNTNTTAVASSSTNPTANVTAALTLIDGSSATGNLSITAGERTQFTDTTTGTFHFQYGSLTIKGGEGDDTIDHMASSGGRVEAGAGDDAVTLRGTSQVALLGEGADEVTLLGGGQTVYLGADEDADTVIFGTTNQTAPAGYAATGAFTSSTRMTTIFDFADGDTIDVVAVNDESIVGDATSLADDYMDLVDAVNAVLGAGAGEINYFHWADGNTYVVVEGDQDLNGGSAGGLFNAVIKIMGEVDLSANTGVLSLA